MLLIINLVLLMILATPLGAEKCAEALILAERMPLVSHPPPPPPPHPPPPPPSSLT